MSPSGIIFTVVGGAMGILFYLLERRTNTLNDLRNKLAETTVDKAVATLTEKVNESREDSIKKLEDYREKKAKYDSIATGNDSGGGGDTAS